MVSKLNLKNKSQKRVLKIRWLIQVRPRMFRCPMQCTLFYVLVYTLLSFFPNQRNPRLKRKERERKPKKQNKVFFAPLFARKEAFTHLSHLSSIPVLLALLTFYKFLFQIPLPSLFFWFSFSFLISDQLIINSSPSTKNREIDQNG